MLDAIIALSQSMMQLNCSVQFLNLSLYDLGNWYLKKKQAWTFPLKRKEYTAVVAICNFGN